MRLDESEVGEAVQRHLPRRLRQSRSFLDAEQAIKSLSARRQRRAFIEISEALLGAVQDDAVSCPDGGVVAFCAPTPWSDRDWLVAAMYAEKVLVNLPSFLSYSMAGPSTLSHLVERLQAHDRRERRPTPPRRPTATELTPNPELDALLAEIDATPLRTGDLVEELVAPVAVEVMRFAWNVAPLLTVGAVSLVDIRHGGDDRQTTKGFLEGDPFLLDPFLRDRHCALPLLEDVVLGTDIDLPDWVAAIGAVLMTAAAGARPISAVTSTWGATRATRMLYSLVESARDGPAGYEIQRRVPVDPGTDADGSIPLFEQVSLGALRNPDALSGPVVARLFESDRLFLWKRDIDGAIGTIRQAETVGDLQAEVARQSARLRRRFQAVEESLQSERHRDWIKTALTGAGGAVGAAVGVTHLDPILGIAGAAVGAALADRLVRTMDNREQPDDAAIRPIAIELHRR